MAHYAELDSNNTVLRVLVARTQDCLDENGQESEIVGAAYLNNLFNGVWKKTSYNTFANKHKFNGVPFRGNYAGIGFTYDPVNDVFYAPQPYPSWILNKTIWVWESPVPKPTIEMEQICNWDEDTKTWIIKTWDKTTKTFI